MRCKLTSRFVALPVMRALWLCALGLMAATAVAAAEQGLGLAVGKPAAVSTFECVGIVLPFQGDDNGNAKCEAAFRRAGTEEPFRPGLDLFVDHRTNWGRSREFRGIGEGMAIPNFSLSEGEERPDMGACERGKWFMRVGPHADKWDAPK